MNNIVICPTTYSVEVLLRKLELKDKRGVLAIIAGLRHTGQLNEMPEAQRAAIAAELTEL